MRCVSVTQTFAMSDTPADLGAAIGADVIALRKIYSIDSLGRVLTVGQERESGSVRKGALTILFMEKNIDENEMTRVLQTCIWTMP